MRSWSRRSGRQLRDTARFRNLLVRGYARVDNTRVVEILRERLDDLAAFRTALARAAASDRPEEAFPPSGAR